MITRLAVPTWRSVSRMPGVIVRGRPFSTQNGLSVWSHQRSKEFPLLNRFVVKAGDHWQHDIDEDGGTTLRERSELSDQSPFLPFMTDVWVAYDFWIAPGPVSSANFCILGQLHNTPDAGDLAGSPPWAVSLDGANLNLYTRTKVDLIATGSGIPIIYPIRSNIERGVWHRLVSRFNYDWRTSGGGGGVQLWLNGELRVNSSLPLGYNDLVGPWMKFGIYRSAAAETIDVTYHDICISLNSLVSRISRNQPLPKII